VRECRPLGAELFHVLLDREAGDALSPAFAAGQFAQLAVPGHSLPRPLSILRCSSTVLEFFIRRVGSGTDWLCGCKAGDLIPVLWPLGKSFVDQLPPGVESEELLLVGGGVGVAPLIAFHEQWPGKSRLLFGHRDAVGAEACALMQGACQPEISTEDGSVGLHGRVTDLLSAVLAEEAPLPRRILCCGPEAMMEAVAALAARHAMPCLLSLETLMGCGIGICVGCAVPMADGTMALACQAGPVFSAEQVVASRPPTQTCSCVGAKA